MAVVTAAADRRGGSTCHLIRQVMAVMIQDPPFTSTLKPSPQFSGWTLESVLSILAAIPRYFYLRPSSIGRQHITPRHRSPLKPKPKLHYNSYPQILFGVNKALDFYHWVEHQCGFSHSEPTCREMARILARADELTRLWAFLRENQNHVLTSTVTAIIKDLGELGRSNEALAAFYRMKQFHCKPDVQAYNVVISALCRAGNMKKARFLLEQMELPGFHCPPDKYTYTILINAYCRRGMQTGCRKAIKRRIYEANHMFRHMIFKGFLPDVVTYNCLINGLCKTNRIERAIELFDDMLEKGCCPDRVTYCSLVRYYSAVNEIDKAVELMRSMVKRKHGAATTSCYTPIIHALCESGRVKEAKELLEEMVCAGFIPREFTYKFVVNALSNAGEDGLGKEISRSIEDGVEGRFRRTLKTRPLIIRRG